MQDLPNIKRPFQPYSTSYFLHHLKPFLALSKHKAPFYSSYEIESCNAYGDLIHLPILTKEQIRDSFPTLLVNSDIPLSKSLIPPYLQFAYTSGTTDERLMCLSDTRLFGLPKLYLSSAEFPINSPSDVRLAILASPICQGLSCERLNETSYDERLSGPTQNILKLPTPASILNVTTTFLEQYHAELIAHEPNILLVDPLYLYFITQAAIKYGVELPAAKIIFYSYEFIPANALALLQKYYSGSRISSYYGATELGGPRIAIECPYGHLHVWNEHVALEIIDHQGQHCAVNQVGRVLITNIANEAMPLLRYQVGDLASWSPHNCHCVLKDWPIIKFHGRTKDSIKTTESFFTSIMLDDLIANSIDPYIYTATLSGQNLSVFLCDGLPLPSLSQLNSLESTCLSYGFKSVSVSQGALPALSASLKFRLFHFDTCETSSILSNIL